MKIKFILGVLFLLFLFGIWFCWFEMFGTITITSNNIQVYNNLKSENPDIRLAPDVSDFGNYKDISFKYYKKHMLFFRSEAYTLTASYDKNTYLKEKEYFKNSYTFYKEPICNDPDLPLEDYKLKPNFNIDGYEFSVVSHEDADFPHNIFFFGFNNKENKIAFIYYYDFDLDYIESFEEHIKDECGW